MKISYLQDCLHDINTIAIWYYNEWERNEPNATLDTVKNKLLSFERRVAFVVHINQQPVAAAELKYQHHANYPQYQFWLDGVYVEKSYRGKGLSIALIDFAISEAFKLKLSTFYLRCQAHLVSLYQAHGFNVVAKEGSKFIMVYDMARSSLR